MEKLKIKVSLENEESKITVYVNEEKSLCLSPEEAISLAHRLETEAFKLKDRKTRTYSYNGIF